MLRVTSLLVAASVATTLPAFAQYSVTGGGGPFPTVGTGGGGDSATMLPTTFNVFPLTTPVPASASNITSVTITGLTHTWSGDVQVVLWDPTMTTGYNLVVRLGLAAPGTCCGWNAPFNGDYTIVKAGDPSITNIWPLTNTTPPTGIYAQEYGTSYGTGWVSGSASVFNTDLASIPVVPGTWSLVMYDGAALDVGGFTGWTMTGDAGPAANVFCSGDGTGAACPCANNGVAGNGCANSLNANGAHLATSGLASVSADTLVLTGTGMPNSSALYFQGNTQVAAGAGAAFGDGKRCVSGGVIRLGTEVNVAGTSQYPGSGDLAIHIKGNCVAGNVRAYQCWYRNADVSFCPPATFNLSNGVQLTWAP